MSDTTYTLQTTDKEVHLQHLYGPELAAALLDVDEMLRLHLKHGPDPRFPEKALHDSRSRIAECRALLLLD